MNKTIFSNKKFLSLFLILLIILTIGFFSKNLISKEQNNINNDKFVIKNTFVDLVFERIATKEQKQNALSLTVLPTDIVIGSPEAKITLINFFSYSCYYCLKWDKEVFPKIKSEYIDKNLVRMIFRPIANKQTLPLTTAIACLGSDTSIYEIKYKMLQEFFTINGKKLRDIENFIKTTMEKNNVNFDNTIKDCYLNQEIIEKSVYYQNINTSNFDFQGTPHFIINGQEFAGYRTYKEFVELFNKILGK